jgi:hypothetical protein
MPSLIKTGSAIQELMEKGIKPKFAISKQDRVIYEYECEEKFGLCFHPPGGGGPCL